MDTPVKKQIRRCYIKKVEDIVQAMDLCDAYDIPDDGLNTLEEYIERIYLHYDSQKHGNYMTKVEDAMVRAGDEDDKKRERLIQMFDSLVKIVGTRDESKRQQFIEDFLSKDGTTENILEDCDRKIGDLRVKETVLMIAGETTAGKSSLLNLLFGMEILPHSVLSCTSTITTVRYGRTQSARVIFMNPDVDDVILDLEGEGLKRFHEFTFQKQRDVDHGIKEVQVFLPLRFLKSGLVLADTPGIGENEFLEEYLMDYIANNDILGFIYIIFTDAGGGVKEDRLLNLLKLVMAEQKKGNKAFPFDPKATMFVANRLDAIPECSRDIVKAHVLEKLKACWPKFDESMLVFFSTKNCQRDVAAHPNYINDSYKHLLHTFSTLFYYVMERRLRLSYKWLEHVLQRIRHCMKTAVTRLALSGRENQENTRKHKDRLTKLQQEADNVIKTLRADIAVKSHDLFDDVKNYLSSPMASLKICSTWKANEIPAISAEITQPKHWVFVKERVDEAFYDRVCEEIEEWTEEKENIAHIEEAIVADIQCNLGVLQEEILNSEYEMEEQDSNRSRTSSRRRSSLSLRAIVRTPLLEMPVKLPTKLNHRLSGFGRRTETKRFSKDPAKWVKERSEKLLKRLLKNKTVNGEKKGLLDILIEQLMQRPHDILNTLEKKIPSMIEANLDMLNTFEELNVHHRKNAATYEEMAEQFEGLKHSLMNYGEGDIFVNDFKSSEVRITENQMGRWNSQTFRVKVSDIVTSRSGSTPSSNVSSLVLHGLWSFMSSGILQNDGQERPIFIKVYMPSSGVTNTFQEVAKLRCLHEESVAEFLGIHHTDAETPACIYDGQLQPLGRYVHQNKPPCKLIKQILNELVHGLSYLHVKGMVHMELSADTVTVCRNGVVRLTGACVPRTASLPIDTEMPVQNFVYLAPEVLRKGLYVSPADIYGFGLLMYELLCNTRAFKRERSFTFQHFVQTVDPEQMLSLDQPSSTGLIESTLSLIKQCVHVSEGQRPNAFGMLEELRDVNGDFKPPLITPRRVVYQEAR